MKEYHLSDWLPTTAKEVALRGWDQLDIIMFSADAYVDHPSFGSAVIGRLLEAQGYRIAIVPQPDWHGDFRDFKKLGRPRLYFCISPGVMDSMVNKYTANKRLRSADAYSPDGRHDKRPEYPTIVYTQILKQIYPDVPVVLGGIEASLRRLAHFDYWQGKLRKSILCDSKADMIAYGMGELPMTEISSVLREYADMVGQDICVEDFKKLFHRHPVRQTVVLYNKNEIPEGIKTDDIVLYSYNEVLASSQKQAENFRHIEEESNKLHAQRLLQEIDGKYVVVNVPFPPMTTEQIDHSFDLPYTRLPHPKYKGKVIPAYEMIKFSVNIHRGCFGGCAFCTISAHQGKFIMSRSKESILKEVKELIQMPDFKGYLSDLGGPSANMYGMGGRNRDLCAKCKRPSCIHPHVCPNLNTSHERLLEIYRAVDSLPGIKKSFIGSGVRYDLLLHQVPDSRTNKINRQYVEELILKHVSGRLKVAPEHTNDQVLNIMRKPPFEQFYAFKKIFDECNEKNGLRQQLIPYFISSHPGCTEENMAELAAITKRLNFKLEQIQDFTPTPMTVSTEMWYTGYHPYTLEKVYSAKSMQEKLRQRLFFFWYKPEEKPIIIQELLRMGRKDLLNKLYDKVDYEGSRAACNRKGERRNVRGQRRRN